MGDRYRVTVERITPAADGDDYTTVIELVAEAEMLSRFAPQAVAETLGADQPGEAPGTAQDVVAGGARAEGRQQRARRRTKAEMDAAAGEQRDAEPTVEAPVEAAAPQNQTPAIDAPPAATAPFNPFTQG